MDKIERITLDLTDCKYIRDFHERIRIAFDFPEWYGRNLDAFWDLMTEPRFFKATIKGVFPNSIASKSKDEKAYTNDRFFKCG